MSELERIEQLEKEIRELKGLNDEGIASYSFSKITDKKLKELVTIKQMINEHIFDDWFAFKVDFTDDLFSFLNNLIAKNKSLIKSYNEEDLKVKFIIPLLNKIDFLSYENEFRDFYELPLSYKTDKFIFNGTTDFVVCKGLFESEKPYFFIQEFKKGQTDGYPEPQLLAELISAVELNNETSMRGAYIVGAIWNFVILEKLGKDKYQYFVSENYDSTKIGDLKGIYKNLLFVKEEIIEMVKLESK
jgi:hypothetical protein